MAADPLPAFHPRAFLGNSGACRFAPVGRGVAVITPTFDQPQFWVAVVKLLWIDVLLSGDNAVVIALACRSLPENRRRVGMIAGAGAAVGLRIVFASVVTLLMALPYLHAVGAALLIWIAVDLVGPSEEEEHHTAVAKSLWHAIRIIVVADAVMSLDNVVAIAAAAQGSVMLIAIGLALSIPLVIAGSTLVMRMLDRFPWLIWAGGGLLGWIAGELLASEPMIKEFIPVEHGLAGNLLPGLGAATVLLIGRLLHMRAANGRVEPPRIEHH
ncbi:MAG: TerC family protein [Phyllobacteriaceae bacterium]|nr:TerC family protein [Phyllobacteriaceae bacterium]